MTTANHDLLMMRLWGEAYEGLLPSARPDSRPARKQAVKKLAASFVQLVGMLKPEICLEIGAHEASFSLGVKRAHPEMRVIAFEASPPVYAQYADSVSGAGVEYVGKCLSDARGTQTFAAPIVKGRTVYTMGSLMADTRQDEVEEHEVEALPLDDYLGADAGRPNMMWIDVEGAAGLVLKGAAESLKSCRALFIEVESVARWEGQATDTDIIATLAQAGLRPTVRDAQRQWQYNCLFLRDEDAADPAVVELLADYIRTSAAGAKAAGQEFR